MGRPDRAIVTSLLLILGVAGARAELKSVPAPAPLVQNGAWNAALKAHPHLLGPPEALKALAKRKPQLYAALKANAANSAEAAGIVRVVEGLPREKAAPFVDRALRHVSRGPTNVHQDTWIWMTQAAEALDFFHDDFTPEQRKQVIDWLNANRKTFTADEGAFHNSTLSKILCYLRVAYATWGENPQARDFRDHALVKLYEGKVLPVLLEFGEGGGFTECGWYTRHSLWHLVQGLELARRFEGYDGLAKAPRFFYQRLAYEMLQPMPRPFPVFGSDWFAVEGDGSGVYGGHTEYPRAMRTLLAQYFRGSELAKFVANRRRRPSNPEAALYDFVFAEAPEAPLPIEQFPLAHFASGIGKVYARSDWSDSATWLWFEASDFWNAHQHYDVGHFEIFREAPLATDSGEYTDYMNPHAMNWLIRTVAHNSLLVYQPGETWPRGRDGGRNMPYANDGGQRGRWDWVSPDLPAWKKKAASYERADMVAYRNEARFMYVAADCTAAYSPEKLKSWVRQILFLRPHTIVVFDRVVGTRPEYAKTWLLHCVNEPALADGGFRVQNGKGHLAVRTLLPEGAKVTKVEGYGYGGATFDPPRSPLSAAAVRWRVEVSPGTAATEDLFLHVLFTDVEQPVELLKAPEGTGVRIGSDEVRFEDPAGARLRLGGAEVDLRREVVKGRFE